MEREYSNAFYKSRKWISCRNGFMTSKYFICEHCGGVAVIAHHKKYITHETIDNPDITLNWNNLEALCIECHNRTHGTSASCSDGLIFDNNGNLKKI